MQVRLPALSIVPAAALTLALLQWSGCVSGHGNYISVAISGYVRSAEDSSAVRGALIVVDDQAPGKRGTYTDQGGYYNYSSGFSREGGDILRVFVTAVDIDGEANGLFVSRDSTIIENNMGDVLSISFRLDLYVSMLDYPSTGTALESLNGTR